jgi:4-hydroxy-tetrahydrodipicolinate synthase
MNEKFKGTGVALVTPFLANKSIDFDSLTKLVNHVIEGGVDYLVALGTTAETPTLSSAEKLEVLNHIIVVNDKRKPLVAGIGGNNTQDVVDTIEAYPCDKLDAILSVVPYYNKPTQQGIYEHFVAVCTASPAPVILYNVPGRTGANMTASTVIKIAQACSNAIAVKEASGNLVQNMAIVQGAPSGFLVLSGDDDLVLPQIAAGMHGVISVAANCFTKDFCQMVQLALAGDFDQARRLHYQLLGGIQLLFADGNPPGVKYVLSKMGVIANEFRLPIVPVSSEVATLIDGFLKER